MSNSIAYGICILIMIIGIKDTIEENLRNKNTGNTVNRVIYYFSVLAALIIINNNLGFITKFIDEKVNIYFSMEYIKNDILKYLLLILVYLIVQVIIYTLTKKIIKSQTYTYKEYNKGVLIILSTFFGIIKSGLVISILFIGIIFTNEIIGGNFDIKVFETLNVYNKLEKSVDLNSEAIDVFFDDKIWDKVSNLVVYYNGETLSEAIKSNEDIDSKAKKLTLYKENDIEKARSLYVWIGSNIEYDFEKAEKILNNDTDENSGAIETWESKTGICFDYASLYVAMARASDIKVRLITGKVFDGTEYVSHAWNEVYIADESRWISVDTTFYKAGDYFDSNNFSDYHIKENIAGEW